MVGGSRRAAAADGLTKNAGIENARGYVIESEKWLKFVSHFTWVNTFAH